MSSNTNDKRVKSESNQRDRQQTREQESDDEVRTMEQGGSRRTILKASVTAAFGAAVVGSTVTAPIGAAEKPPEKMRPQPGDLLVHRFGDRAKEPVVPDDVPGGAELLQASALDPETGVMRDGSRLNGINVVRVNPEDFDAETAPYAVAGIVAYSSVCTHQGCDLTQWLPETRTFKCYCHYSEFDASKLGQPMHGPATRKLAILPLELADSGSFVITDKFVGKVGFKKG